MPAEFESDERTDWWDDTYAEYDEPPWETGEPQPALVDAAEHVEGRVLDVGCGLGTEALFLAARGHDVVGVDFSLVAVERARERAAAASPAGSIRFDLADALALGDADLGSFDGAVDCGLLHALDPGDRDAYAESLAEVVETGGRAVVLSFGEGAPTDWGPTPVTADAFRETFSAWEVLDCRESTFRTRQADVPATLGVVKRR